MIIFSIRLIIMRISLVMMLVKIILMSCLLTMILMTFMRSQVRIILFFLWFGLLFTMFFYLALDLSLLLRLLSWLMFTSLLVVLGLMVAIFSILMVILISLLSMMFCILYILRIRMISESSLFGLIFYFYFRCSRGRFSGFWSCFCVTLHCLWRKLSTLTCESSVLFWFISFVLFFIVVGPLGDAVLVELALFVSCVHVRSLHIVVVNRPIDDVASTWYVRVVGGGLWSFLGLRTSEVFSCLGHSHVLAFIVLQSSEVSVWIVDWNVSSRTTSRPLLPSPFTTSSCRSTLRSDTLGGLRPVVCLFC